MHELMDKVASNQVVETVVYWVSLFACITTPGILVYGAIEFARHRGWIPNNGLGEWSQEPSDDNFQIPF